VVSICGPSDFVSDWETSVDGKDVLPKVLGGCLETHRGLYIQASPLSWVTPDAATILCIHGIADKYVAHEQSEWLVEKLRAAGVEAKLLNLEGEGHGLKGADAALLEFFDTHLQGRHLPSGWCDRLLEHGSLVALDIPDGRGRLRLRFEPCKRRLMQDFVAAVEDSDPRMSADVAHEDGPGSIQPVGAGKPERGRHRPAGHHVGDPVGR